VDGQPAPPKTVVTGARYLQVVADAAIHRRPLGAGTGRRFHARLARREPKAMADWKRIANLLRYFEQHPEWRRMAEYGKLAIVQDPAKGGLLSGGILDMIAVKHTPVRPVPRQHLSAESLAGATMAVNVDADARLPSRKKCCAISRAPAECCLLARPAGKIKAPWATRSRSTKPNSNASTTSGAT